MAFRTFIAFVTWALMGACAFADAPVQLRARIEVQGGAVTLGDVFDGAGEASGRVIAPAPAPGRQSQLSSDFLVAAAQSAGLSWVPPEGVETILINGRTLRMSPMIAQSQTHEDNRPPAAIRRGEMVTLAYSAPGLTLTSRVRAMQDGAIGDVIRLSNPQSNMVVEATITGPGAARAASN